MVYVLTGPEKLIWITQMCKNMQPNRVADLGGNIHSYRFLQDLFPNAHITTVNNYKPHLQGCPHPLMVDLERAPLKLKNMDMIVALDVIEHLTDSDQLIIKAKEALRPGGTLLITTPNLANLFNRLFLLFGFSLTNYHPSRYRTGNPFLTQKDSIPLWNENAHKSIFTVRGLRELLMHYGFHVLWTRGYSYAQDLEGGSERNVSVRRLINTVLPKGLREGIVIAAQK